MGDLVGYARFVMRKDGERITGHISVPSKVVEQRGFEPRRN
jgi:hypothetical protein